MKDTTVNILGTEYVFETDASLNDSEGDGAYFPYSKRIAIREKDKLLDEDSTEKEKQSRLEEVSRHEIIHAVFREAGLDEYCEDETLVDFLAIQSPKLFKIFKQLDIL